VLYLFTRSSQLISDGEHYIDLARAGDGRLYAEIGHFLQVPLTHGLWRGLSALGLDVPVAGIYLGLSLAGALAAIVSIGEIAASLFASRRAGLVASVLLGTTLVVWTQWNGELSTLALGFIVPAMYCALRGSTLVAAVLWALAVTSHAELALVAPAFFLAPIIRSREKPWLGKLWRGAILCVVAGGLTIAFLVIGSWLCGRWHDGATFAAWIRDAWAPRSVMMEPADPVRALKGLVTAYTVAGHVWGDILRGRTHATAPFVASAALGGVVLASTAALVLAGARARWNALLAAAWIVPTHVLLNWHFAPTSEEYHVGAMPGLVLLVTGGLVSLRVRHVVASAYVAACVALNLLGCVLPMQAYGADMYRAHGEVLRTVNEAGRDASLVTCSDRIMMDWSRELEVKRLYVPRRDVAHVRAASTAWVRERLSERRRVFLLGPRCYVEEWVPAPNGDEVDLRFLADEFTLVQTPMRRVPLAWVSQTNPFSWRQAALFEIQPKP
jgi:hypothetical protein